MARSYTQVYCSIWDDDDFCKLTSNAQHAYLLLITQGNIAACGTLALTLRRWSRLSADIAVDKALAELETAGYIAIDADTEELFVRTFAKWDGGYTHTLRRKAVIASARAIKSSTLRSTAVDELAKLGLSIDTTVPPDSHSGGTGQGVESQRFQGYVGEYVPDPVTKILEREPEPLDDAEPPSEFCPKHPNGTTEPCGACGTAKRMNRVWHARQANLADAARAAIRRAILDCTVCDHNGQVPIDDGMVARCTLHPTRLVEVLEAS